MERTKWVDARDIGLVTSIFQPSDASKLIGLGGRNGVAWVDSRSGEVRSTIKLPPQRSFVEFVDLESDGTFEILDRGGHGWSPAVLFDSMGKKLWTYPERDNKGALAIDDLAPGDLDGDGKSEFVAGYNGSDGLRRVDQSGVDVWTKEGGNIWHVEIVDLDGDKRGEIVHSGDTADRLTVRDAAGVVQKSLPTGSEQVVYFSVLQSRDRDVGPQLVVSGSEKIELLSADSKSTSVPSRFATFDGKAAAAQIRWKQDAPLQLAVLQTNARQRFSVLSLYNADHALMYEEVLDEPCLTIRVVTSESGPDRLLVGGAGRVWEYRPKP